MPEVGIVKFPAQTACKFRFKNGPFSNFNPSIPGINVQTEIVEYDETSLNKKMNEIKNHFQEHMHIYIPVVLSTSGLLLTMTIFLICCFRQIRNQTQPIRPARRTRNRQTESIETLATAPPQNIVLKYLSPKRAGWEISEV